MTNTGWTGPANILGVASGDRGAGSATKVGVIEVGEALRRRSYFATHAAFCPDQTGFVRAEASQQGADRFAVTDDHTIDSADLTSLGTDA